MKLICPVSNKSFLKFLPAWTIEMKEIGRIKFENDDKNVVANFSVSVEFNQSYKLLLVSCLLDQKKFFDSVRNKRWLHEANWEERKQTIVLKLEKKLKERKRKTLCLLYVEVFSSAVETYYLWNEVIKDVIGRIHFA